MAGICAEKPPAHIWFKYEGAEWEELVIDNVPASYTVQNEAPENENNVCVRLYLVTLDYKFGSSETSGTFEYLGPIRGKRVQRVSGFTILDLLNYNEAGQEVETRIASASYEDPNAYLNIVAVELKPGQPPCEGPEQSCVFRVFDGDAKEVFKKTAPTCPKVKVACGEDCPSQFLKCKSNAHPGHKCIPCEKFRS